MTSSTATPPEASQARRAARPPGPLARAASDARLAWAVALVLALALAAASVLLGPLVVAERDRTQVVSVAGAMAARLTTFSADDLEAWADGVESLATPAYADRVAGLVDDSVRQRMVAAGVVSRGQVGDVYVQDLDGAGARAFAVVRQRTGNLASDASRESTVRMTMTLRRTAGGWLVDDVSVLPDPTTPIPLNP